MKEQVGGEKSADQGGLAKKELEGAALAQQEQNQEASLEGGRMNSVECWGAGG